MNFPSHFLPPSSLPPSHLSNVPTYGEQDEDAQEEAAEAQRVGGGERRGQELGGPYSPLGRA